jgi:hypothetical protein
MNVLQRESNRMDYWRTTGDGDQEEAERIENSRHRD